MLKQIKKIGICCQIWKWFTLVCLLLTLCGCALKEEPPCIKNGKTYGILEGEHFRGTYWDHYKKALSYIEGQCWPEAESSLKAAIEQRDKDERGIQTHDLMYIDYYPHRELGIILYFQGQYQTAIGELERSAKDENKSGRTKHYLNLAKKKLIRQQKQDVSPPKITILSPRDGQQSDDFTVLVSGFVTDDTYVDTVSVNGSPIPVTEVASKFFFKVAVRLDKPGKNPITITATDGFKKSGSKELSVFLNVLDPRTETQTAQNTFQNRLFASLESCPNLMAQTKPVIELEGWDEKNEVFWAEHSLKININDENVRSVAIYKNNESKPYLEESPQELNREKVKFHFDFGENSIRIIANYTNRKAEKTFCFYRNEYKAFLPPMRASLASFDEREINPILEESLRSDLSESGRFKMVEIEKMKKFPLWTFEWSFEQRESVIGKSEPKSSGSGDVKQPSEKPRQGHFLDINVQIMESRKGGKLVETLSVYDEHEDPDILREKVMEKIVSQLEIKIPRAEGIVQGIENGKIAVTLDNQMVKKRMRLIAFDVPDEVVRIRGEAVIQELGNGKFVAEIQGNSEGIRRSHRVVTR